MKGQAKGLRQVCLERFGDDAVRGKKQDGLVQMLENEPDFRFYVALTMETVFKIARTKKSRFFFKLFDTLVELKNEFYG